LDKKITIFQWMQLLALAGVHFLVDMLGNMLPSILPEIRSEFALSLSVGSFVLAALYLTANGAQMLTGHLRPERSKPLFLHLGLILAAVICLLALLPRSGAGVPAMFALALVSGFGIAVTHPEALRAVHLLNQIPPAISTAVFMTGGFLGFAGGGAISTILVSRYGLAGLYPLLLCPVAGVLAIALLKVRLATEPKVAEAQVGSAVRNRLSFRLVVLMAIPAAVSTTIVVFLLPTRLNELGFELTFGGYSVTMFGLGGALGSFMWGAVAHKKGELPCAIAALFFTIPFLVVYLLLVENRPALWLLFGAGFCSVSAYILMITLARYARGPTLGWRMALIVGGTWALAILVFMALVPVTGFFGTHFTLSLAPVGYLFSAAFGLHIMLKTRSPVRQGVRRI
jgi:FSR family fosmidomycin resistance protein-like MFS transporter